MLKKQSQTLVEPSTRVGQPIDTTEESPPTPLAGISDAQPTAASCLKAYVSDHGENSKTFLFLEALASEMLEQLGKGGDKGIGTRDIYRIAMAAKLKSHPDKINTDQATRWVSEAWNGWLKKRDERLGGLQEFAANQGLPFYPWPEKKGDGKGGSGRSSLYTIEAKPLTIQPNATLATADADILYIRETTPKAAWWASWFFSKEFHLTGWRRALFLTPAIVMLLVALGVFLIVWLTLSQQQAMAPNRVLVFVITASVIGYVAWRYVAGVARLGDKRIIMAPDILLNFREYNVQLELTRADRALSAPSRLGLVRYAATCPICGAKVQVNGGQREFHGRLVGRCQESPDEHVFSFDRVTRSGKNLRATLPH